MLDQNNQGPLLKVAPKIKERGERMILLLLYYKFKTLYMWTQNILYIVIFVRRNKTVKGTYLKGVK